MLLLIVLLDLEQVKSVDLHKIPLLSCDGSETG